MSESPSGVAVGRETANEGDATTFVPAVIQRIKKPTGDVQLHRSNLTNVEGNQYTTINHNNCSLSHTTVHPTDLVLPLDVDKLKGWLSIINQRAIQKDNHSKKTPGTVEWILVDSKLTTWLVADEGILWGTGMPGAGKTVLAASVVDHLLKMQQEDPSICVAVAYCRYTDPWTAEEIMGSLIRQQVESHPEAVIPIVKPIFDRLHAHDVRPSQEDLMGILRKISSLKVFSRTFYAIDGLDEASSDLQVEILDSLASLPVHFLITSRRLDILKQLVPHASFFDIVVRDHDIGLLIERKLRQMPNLRGVLKDETLKSTVISRIIEKSSGMFLLASLQLDMLAAAVSVKDLRERLERLPDGVTEMYAATMKRIEKTETSELAKRALTWLLYSRESLSIDDLRLAVAVHPETYAPDPEAVVEEETFLAIFCGLVTFEPETRLARLVHFTARDFLVPYMLETERNPHSLLASTCVAHLHLWTSGARPARFTYFFDHWSVHAEAADPLPDRVKQFVGQCERCLFPSTITVPWGTGPGPHILVRYNSLKLLKLWISTRSQQYVKQSVPKTLMINSRSTVGGFTPLAIAAVNGHIEAGRILLQVESIDTDAQDNAGATPLIHALRRGHVEFARILVQAGCDADIAGWGGTTALMEACRLGQSDMFDLFQLDGMDVNASDDDGYTALMMASMRGFGRAVRSLLEVENVAVNSSNGNGRTALLLACSSLADWSDIFGVVDELLQVEGIQVNLADGKGRTALMEACSWGLLGVVELLSYREDLDVNLADVDGRTALGEAARNGHTEIVKLLMNTEGIVADREDLEGRSPLFHASRHGHVEVVQILLLASPSRGMHEYLQSASWALIEASFYDRLEVVGLLLAVEGVNVNAVDQEGQTALMRAAGRGSRDVVEKLIAVEGVDVNAVDMNGRTALIHACSCMWWDEAYDAVVEILKGAKDKVKVNVADKLGRTALMEASLRGYGNIVKMLCNDHGLGADVGAVDAEGQTALSLACHGPSWAVPCRDGNKLLGHKNDQSLDIFRRRNQEGVDIFRRRTQGEYLGIFDTLVASRLREISLLQASLKALNEGGATFYSSQVVQGVVDMAMEVDPFTAE
ncbi:ankyrin [Coprinopsis marcescibilis]|nr:ankyrin [Coprinopsis marcescibilis]